MRNLSGTFIDEGIWECCGDPLDEIGAREARALNEFLIARRTRFKRSCERCRKGDWLGARAQSFFLPPAQHDRRDMTRTRHDKRTDAANAADLLRIKGHKISAEPRM